MTITKLFIFLEGDDDVRFFENIIYPKLLPIKIFPIKYASKKDMIIKKFVRRIESRDDEDYIFVTDLDNHTYQCCTTRKEKRINEYNIVDNKIIVVKEEIESWYLAGIVENCIKDLEPEVIPENTDNITKEDFDNLIPNKYQDSRMDFMIEILRKCYNLETAMERNSSFKYFVEKFLDTSPGDLIND